MSIFQGTSNDVDNRKKGSRFDSLKYIPLTKASLCALIYKLYIHCANYVNLIKLAKRKESKK